MPYRAVIRSVAATGDLVTLRTYPDAVAARLDAAGLEHEGIEAHVFDEGSHNIVMRGAMSGVRLQVRESDVERATAHLDRAPEEEDEASDDDESGEVRCPRCELAYCFHERTRLSSSTARTPLAVLAMPFMLFAPRRWHCHRCGHVWDDEKAGPTAITRVAAGDPVPVFRLQRGHGGMGLFLGLMVGAVGAMFGGAALRYTGPQLGVALLASALIGWRIGRALRYDVCSKPTCRAPLPPNVETCPKCSGEIAGNIRSAEEHYSAAADVRRELASMRASMQASMHASMQASMHANEATRATQARLGSALTGRGS